MDQRDEQGRDTPGLLRGIAVIAMCIESVIHVFVIEGVRRARDGAPAMDLHFVHVGIVVAILSAFVLIAGQGIAGKRYALLVGALFVAVTGWLCGPVDQALMDQPAWQTQAVILVLSSTFWLTIWSRYAALMIASAKS